MVLLQQFQFLPLYKKSSYTFYDNSIGGFQIFSYSAHYKVLTRRSSNLELLRILSMFMIVVHHFAFHGTFDFKTITNTNQGALLATLILESFGKVGVAIFVLIGAYFLVEKSFSFKRVMNLVILTSFYSIIIYIILRVLKFGIPNDYLWTKIIFPYPIPTNYWFVTSYIVMLLSMPMLNIVIRNINQRKHLYILLFLTVFIVVIPDLYSYFPGKMDIWIGQFGATDATYFIYLYFIASYFRLYSSKLTRKWEYWLILVVIGNILLFISYSLPLFISDATHNYLNYSQLMIGQNSTVITMVAVSIFMLFVNINIGKVRCINYISASMFGVYLLHENSFLRPIIWNYINNNRFTTFTSMIINGLKYSFLIFIICILIDIVFRRILFEKKINKLSLKLGNYLDKKLLGK
ncbi:acyltransferase family protein [Ligilactobacillus salivarius]|uniref:acyltransferase n=6 Tax=Ligilactobacillus salivarius TaxID=1624 RepID=UPI0033153D42